MLQQNNLKVQQKWVFLSLVLSLQGWGGGDSLIPAEMSERLAELRAETMELSRWCTCLTVLSNELCVLMKNKGPHTEPWGTPMVNWHYLNTLPSRKPWRTCLFSALSCCHTVIWKGTAMLLGWVSGLTSLYAYTTTTVSYIHAQGHASFWTDTFSHWNETGFISTFVFLSMYKSFQPSKHYIFLWSRNVNLICISCLKHSL